MTDSITGYTFSGSQMARDLLNFSGMSGTSIAVKGIIWSYGYQVKFTADSDLGFNVFVYGGRVYRLTSTNTVRENIFEFVADADILSSVYLAGGNIRIDTERHASPARCIRREWGGEQIVTKQIIVNSPTVGPYYTWVYVSITSSHNSLLNINGDLVRYVIPTLVTSPQDPNWLVGAYQLSNSHYFPPLALLTYGIEDATGLDADSILDVSYSTVCPYKFNLHNGYLTCSGVDVPGNCTHEYKGVTYEFYQIDGLSESCPSSLVADANTINASVLPDHVFSSYVPQDMSLIINNRKTLSLIEKSGAVDITVTPFLGFAGMGFVIAQGDNVTTAMASKLPWMGDAWVSYQIQKKGTDEAKMYYDTVKGLMSVAIGMGGSKSTGGASAMSVPSSVSGLADPYVNQHYTEQYTKQIPYGNGAPYGDLGELYYQLLYEIPPVYVAITKYTGQPEFPDETGRNFGYPAFGYDTITYDGFYAGAVSTLNTNALVLNQDEVSSVISKITRGIRT